jgi:transposase
MLRLIFTEEAIGTLHYERYHYPDPRVQVKMEVLWLKSQGIEHQEIARLTGVTPRTVQRYLHEYLEGGIERLKQNNYVGTPSALNAHATTLKEHFEKHPPHTLAEAQNIIEKLTGLRRSRPQVRECLLRLGMKCRKIAAVPGKVDEAKQQEQERFLRDKLEPRLDDAEAGRRKIFLWTPPILSTAPF